MCSELKGKRTWPCAQCHACRVNARRTWVTRMMLESCAHPRTWFVTLTYNDDHLPVGGTLVPRDLTLFLKRFRKSMEPDLVRFFGVGEYGDRSMRPHYHAIVWTPDRADVPDLVEKAWPLGFVKVGLASRQALEYVCGYVLKKLVYREDPLPDGLHPEFARMSRMPGIGALTIPDLAAALNSSSGAAGVAALGDVPPTVRLEGHELPVGRYLRHKLREGAGYPKTDWSYNLARLLNAPQIPRAEREAKRLEHLAKARKAYRRRKQKVSL